MAGEDLGWYDIAQICLNGHVINESSNEFPQKNAKFCARCGQPTIIACPDCGHDIRGDYTSAVVVAMASHYHAPAFCDNCGRPYPWTRQALEAAETLTDQMTDLSGDEVAEVKNNLEHLVSDSAQTKVAALRVKALLAKAGGAVPGMIRDLMVDVASETAKKILLG